MLSRTAKPGILVLMVILLVIGSLALVYGAWARPLVAAEQAVRDGRLEEALEHYGVAEARFDDLRLARQFFPADYQTVIANQLWLYYRLGRYDETIEKAETAPAGPGVHFWTGCAFFEKARLEEQPENLMAWLSRSEEEFRKAVEFAPADWDAKYNYELTSRLLADMRKQPKAPPKQLLELLRPKPKSDREPVRKTG